MAEIFVGALPFRMTEDELKQAFRDFGPIRSIEIHADWVDPRFEPYAHIDLEKAEDAIEAMDGKKIRSNHLRVHMRNKNV